LNRKEFFDALAAVDRIGVKLKGRLSMKVLFALLTAVVLLVPQPLLAGTVFLFGKIGNFPIIAWIDQKEGELSGWYFYLSRAKEIQLEGKIEPDGTFQMDEHELGNSKSTGRFEGKASQDRWTGAWRKDPGGAPLPLSLDVNRDQLKQLSGKFSCQAVEPVVEFDYTFRRKLKLVVAKGAVKAMDIEQTASDKHGDEQGCSIDLKYLKQAPSETGILLKVKGESPDEDEGCAIRIAGNADVLWIRFEDSSGGGDGCRFGSEYAFCSSRAFWNDILLDRHTQKCKVVR
jgi:hypothetical protein